MFIYLRWKCPCKKEKILGKKIIHRREHEKLLAEHSLKLHGISQTDEYVKNNYR